MAQISNGISQFVQKQTLIYREYVSDFLRYQQCEFDSMLELQTLLKKYQKDFMSTEKKLTAKKEELFKDKKIEKWKLDPQTLVSFPKASLLKNKDLAYSKMLPKETEEAQNLFLCFSYYANRLRDEFNRIHTQKADNFYEIFNKILNDEENIIPQVFLLVFYYKRLV